MRRNVRSRMMSWGGLLATVLGAAGCVLLFMQPWKSCPEDDSSAGCPATMVETNLLVASFAILLLGLAVWVWASQGADRRIRNDD